MKQTAELKKVFDHPKAPSGRFLCSPEHPMPKDVPEWTRWEHTNFVEVDGSQKDGWPCGDTVLMRCTDCGLEHRIELPQ